MNQNQELNNTCILFDKDNEAQQKAAFKYYNDNGWLYSTDKFMQRWESTNYIGVNNGDLGYWWNWDNKMKVIDLPKEYYPIDSPNYEVESVSIGEERVDIIIPPIVESELIRHEMEKDMVINLINQSEIDILINHWFKKYKITRK